MGIVERIRQIQEEQARKASKAEAIRVVATQKVEQERLTKRETRENFVKQQYEKVIRESGVLVMLEEIENNILQKSQKTHKILQHYGGGYIHQISLVWGYTPLSNGDFPGGYDFNSIDIEIDPDTESISINNYRLPKETWHESSISIENSLAEAFLHPNRNEEPSWMGDKDL